MIITYMIIFLIFGAGTTILIKEMDMITVNNQHFAHPYIQCTNLFIGESLCLLVYTTYKYIKRKQSRVSDYRQFRRRFSNNLPNCYTRLGVLSFSIPGFLYVFSIYLMFIGLALTAPSVYQIIRGFLTVPVLIFSLIFLKRKFYRHHIFGVICIVLGLVIVGIDSIIEKSPSSNNPEIGIIVLVISQVIAGIVLVFEEYLMSKMEVEPLQAIGIEGISGLIFSLIVLIILNFIPCKNPDFCSGGKVENTIQVLKDIFSDYWLMLILFSSIIVITILYWAGIYTTRYASALARATLDTAKIVIVWIFSISVGWETFLWVEFVGFIIMVFGTLVYNEIIILPYCGFREAVKKHKSDQNNTITEGWSCKTSQNKNKSFTSNN